MTAFVLSVYILWISAARVFSRRLYPFRAVVAFGTGFLQWFFLYRLVLGLDAIPWDELPLFSGGFPYLNSHPVTGLVIAFVLFVTASIMYFRFETVNTFHKGIGALKVAAGLVLSTFVPVYICTAYKADYAIHAFLAGYIAVNLLWYIRRIHRTFAVVAILSGVITAVLGVSALAGIIITPLSAFLAWFDLLSESQAGGLVPLLFAVTGGAFSSVLGGMSYRRGYAGPLLGNILVLLVLLAVIHQSVILAVAAAAVMLFSLLFLASRRKTGFVSRSLQSVAAVAAVSALIALPFSLGYTVRGSRFVDNSLSPWLKNMTVAAFPGFPFLYNIEGYGYSFNQRTIGGKPALSKRAVFTVEAPRSSVLYLRTESYDSYNGKGWEQSPRLLQAAVENKDTPYFIPLRNTAAYERVCSITVHTDFFDKLPHTLSAYTFSSIREQIQTLQRADVAVGFLPEKPLVRDNVLNVYRNETEPESLRFRDSFLAVPPDIPEEVVSLAQRLGSGIAGEPRKILSNIETYLAQNYTYSLEVTYIPREAIDATWHFLFNSETGYCTHFATAYALLARLNGIPARYVSGFLVYLPKDADRTVVTGLSAHAWPEVWIDGSGWITKEATPPMNPDVRQEFLYYGDYLSGSSYTSRQLSEMLENTDVVFEEEEQKGLDIPGYALVLFLTGVFIAACIFLVPRLASIMPSMDPSVEIRRLLKRVVRYYRMYGFPPPSYGGWEAWGRRIAEARKENTAVAVRISMIASRLFYGDRPPCGRDRKYIKLFIRRGFQ
ncbi:MAG: transglutaminase domain-containing protein [Spirochaetales bacterium]|nr:transglutaminase domain-containing protein [Spirochaetales bacterium]